MKTFRPFLIAAALLALMSGADAGPSKPAAVNGCVYNSAAPTLSTGQTAPFQCDTNAQLKISGTINATTAANATSTPPSLSSGSQGIFQSLFGALFVQPIFGGTPVDATHGLPVNVVSATSTDQCPSSISVNQATSTDILTSIANLHICSVVLISAAQQAVSLTEGTGTLCANGATGLFGGTTASAQVAANGGFSAIAAAPWLITKTTADHLCLIQGTSSNISGVITYTDK